MKKNLVMKSLLTIMMVIVLLSMTTIVFAEDTDYSVTMSLTSNSKLKEGDTVIVQVNLTNISAGNGIDTITASLNYDTDVFEAVDSSNITAEAGWTPSYADATKILIVQRNDKVTEAGKLLTLKLKVKSVISVDSTTIKLQDIVASGGRVIDEGTGDINVSNASVTIVGDQKTQNNNSSKKDNTVTSKNTLPKTGLKQYGIFAIVILSIIAVFSYILYKKIAKNVK